MNRLLDFDNYWPPAGTTVEYKGIQCGLWYIGSLTLTAEEYDRPIQSVVITPHDTLNLLYG